jgi:hypothetical protein
MRLISAGGAAFLVLAQVSSGRPDLPSLMHRQAPTAPESAPAGLPTVRLDPLKSPFPLDDRLDADAVFDRPFAEALHAGLVWYLERHGVQVVEDEPDLRMSGVLVDYEGWRRPGRWGAGVSLRARLYQGHKVLITDTLRSAITYPHEAAAVSSGSRMTPQQALFSRLGLHLAEQLLDLIRRAAPPAARDNVPRSAARSLERGVLTVAASVENAEVFLDGALVGTTPLVDLILAAGPHDLEVKKEGFRSWKRRIHVVERAASRFYAELETGEAEGRHAEAEP